MTVVGRVVAAGVIVVGSLALGWPAHAAAMTGRSDSSGQITSPSDGEVVSGSSVTVSARTGLMQLNMGLYVEGPSMPSQKVAGGGANQTISGTFDAGSAPNGTFTVTLKGEITGTRYDSRTFKLRRPAEAPGNVNASKQGTEKVVVTWSRGSEPDLQSYEVSNTQSGIVGRLSADSACSGSSCKAALAVPSKAVGQKVGFTVKAFRGDGDGGSIGSGESAPAYITFPAPPAAQPTKKTTTNTGQTPKNTDTKKVDALPTLPAKKQPQPTSKPTTRKPTTSKLPAIPDTDSSGNLPIPTADPADDEQGENGGLAPADAKEETDSAPVQSDGVKAQSSESPMGNIGQYGIYVAGGILLLLLGAHAGAWARRRAIAGGGGGSAPATTVGVPGGGGTPVGGVQVDPGTQANLAAQGGGGNAVPAGHGDAGVPATAAVRRRPAVILAVAKTRVPEQPHAQQSPLSADRQPAEGPVQPKPSASEQPRNGVPAALPPLHRSADDVREVAPDALPGPVRIALPSSAVTDVPQPSAPVTPLAAGRLEERWDDYLPPSPRSMEDSGFWERPQPGAADFWAADDDEARGGGGDNNNKNKGNERAYVGGLRQRDGES
ncbi:hypothetical protein [Nonomuraea sp. NPDC050643]|uniref:hypothetical protein n=1 Tax=Nonomuraea sp. NPDC050643 TaxID=3155660 RepID=UPI00340BBB1E